MAEADGVLRVEKMGPMLADWVPVLLGHHQVVVKPVVNPSALAPSDSYEIGNRMREVVLSRNPVECFPGSKGDARGCDLDHTIPWQPGAGLTRPDNLAPCHPSSTAPRPTVDGSTTRCSRAHAYGRAPWATST